MRPFLIVVLLSVAFSACDDSSNDGKDGTATTDVDGDGWGTPDDCDDDDAAINPDAAESCNGVDDNCDGIIDEGAAPSTWYTDGDGDGFGDPATSAEACIAPSGAVADDSDCDDSDAGVNPDAAESCNDVDDNCDGVVDEGVSATTWYTDGDGDGFGDPATGAEACAAPSGSVADATDCDDTDDTVHPDANEICNGVDDDCDGATDEASAVDAPTWYVDIDEDGYGDAGTSTVACSQPTGFVGDDTDCDDTDEAINPDAAEVCNGVDDDCDGGLDDDPSTVGSTEYCPGVDCADLLASLPTTPSDGLFWIDPDGAGAFEVACDMSTDGGGWTLVMKFDDGASDLAYDAVQWEATDLLNESDTLPNTDVDGTNAKFDSYNTVEGDELRLEFVDPATDIWYEDLAGQTALSLFQGAEVMVAGSESPSCNGELLSSVSEYDASLMKFGKAHQFYGVNGADSGAAGIGKIRFGFASNDEWFNEWVAEVGVGLYWGYSSSPEHSVAWIAHGDCSECSGCYGSGSTSSDTAANLWVR